MKAKILTDFQICISVPLMNFDRSFPSLSKNKLVNLLIHAWSCDTWE